nr:hypothetical protein [Frondihabitans australicus]
MVVQIGLRDPDDTPACFGVILATADVFRELRRIGAVLVALVLDDHSNSTPDQIGLAQPSPSIVADDAVHLGLGKPPPEQEEPQCGLLG